MYANPLKNILLWN